MSNPQKLIVSVLGALFLSLAVPAVPAIAAPVAAERAPAAQERTAAPEQATDREVQRYADREQQSNRLERFEGGATIVIFGSLTAVLLGVLLVLILI
jgi:hypothetical protein